MNPHLYILFGICFGIVLIIFELYKPARVYESSEKKDSYITNFLLFLCNNAVTFLLQVAVVFSIASAYSPNAYLFTLLPVTLQVFLGIIILDVSIWVWHFLNHKINFLWKFHKCHHSEKYLNATSALRFHIGELLLSVVWKSLVLIITGIPLWIFIISEFLLTFCAMFHHANISLPKSIRKPFERVFISPYLHRVHHSTVRHEHDTNYGVIFSLWDMLFKTVKRIVPENIGLKGIAKKNFYSFLSFPFTKK